VGVSLSEEGGRWRWCRFNTSILTQNGKRRDETLPEDEAEIANLSWLHGKKA
jgi:hypothetical protein